MNNTLFVYRYAAINNREKHIYGNIDAYSEQMALDLLNTKQYQVLEIYCKGEKHSLIETAKKFWENTFKRVNDQNLLLFTRELALMLKVGIPVDRAFTTLADFQEDEMMNKTLQTVKNDIRRGISFSYSTIKHPRVFPPIYRALLEVGESTGKLPEMLEELAGYQEKELMTKKKVQSALTYPCFVMGATTLILIFMMIYYIPSFTSFLSGLHVKLPLPTQILMCIVRVFQSPGAITTIIVGIVVFAYLYYNFSRTMMGRYFVDNTIINLPIIGEFILMVSFTRFARTFSLMYKSGITIDKIIDASRQIVGYEPLKDIFEQCKLEVMEGEAISKAFSSKRYIPSLMKSFLLLGEETESIAHSMEKIAEIYDEQIAYKIESFISLLEPLFMAVVAFIVGFVVISLFLPIYSLISNIGV